MTNERQYRIISIFTKMVDGKPVETEETQGPFRMTKKWVEKKAEETAKEFDQFVEKGAVAVYNVHIESVTVLEKEWKGQIPMPNAVEDAFTWISIHDMKTSRVLEEGDVLKFRVTNPTHEKYGKWVYGICTGNGFGCDPRHTGNAIFVDWVGFDPLEVMSHNNNCEKSPYERGERWERWFKLFVLVNDNKEKVKK